MKKIATLITLLLCALSLFAQAPENFTYQAVVRNASNALVTNAQVGVRVNILQGTASGNAVYSETHIVSTNANGLVTVNIGGGSVLHGSFADIDWSDGPYFLKTDIDPNGGNDYSITSVQQLLSVPYALYAKEAANSFSGDYNDLVNVPQIPQIPADISAFNNDVGYITAAQIPEQVNADWNATTGVAEILNKPAIPTVPSNVSAFTNDAGYITGYTETDPQFNAWDKDYNDLTNKPVLFDGDYNSLSNKPVLFDGDYNSLTNQPTIPTVPTNVSAFANDAGYLTSYTETDPQFNAWDKSYNDLINTPTNVSAFANDAQYITAEAIPTHVSAFTNDAEYITIAAVPTQVSAFENDALYITEGELQQTVNVINNTFDSVDNVMNDMDNTIDSLRSRIEELEGTHTPPTVMTTGAANVTYRAAVVNGSIVHVGASSVTARGFCYDTVMHPTVDGNLVNCGSGAGDFSTNLLNIAPNTTYYVRAYATNIWGTNYGNELTFTTLTEHTPSVEIVPATDISFTSFTVGGDVTDSGTYAVTARGLCWATTPDPVMTGEHLHLGNGIGAFSATLTDLQPETTYYVRAYAVNAVGVAYSNNLSVTTLTPQVPTVTTDSVSMYNECLATVVSDGGAPILQRGFCYDTLPNPTLENGVVTVDGGVGEFNATLSGLPIGKLYFVRAFATNAKGTTYGNQFDFYAGCDMKTLTDYDGNVYNTVLIGNQCWMKENLRTTHYSDGWPIEHGTTSSYDVAYYYYPGNNNSDENVAVYGLLYNWKATMHDDSTSNSIPSDVQGVCPEGWHVPSHAEWTELTNYVKSQSQYVCGSSNNAIAKALADSTGWSNSGTNCAVGNNQNENNATGFSALPAGYAITSISEFGRNAYFWSSTVQSNMSYAQAYSLNYSNATVQQSFSYGNGLNPNRGHSVRCLRDY